VEKRKILITGGAGFIASSLAERLVRDEGNYVIVVDNLSTGKLANIPEFKNRNGRFIKCDVNRYEEILPVITSFAFDYVFHYAAVVGVQRTLNNPVSVLRDIEGIRNILELSKSTGVKRVFFSSSSEVYGEPVELPQNEVTTPLNSRLPYAVVKNVGEAFCRSYHDEFGLNYTIFRFFNTYGPRQSTDFVMSRFLRAALHNEDITVYGDGSQTRTFCYIDDNLDATIRIMEEDLYINDVVNIGSDVETPIIDLARLVLKITGSSGGIVHLPPLKEGDMKRRLPDISKMRRILNRPLVSLEEGIQRLIDSGKFKD